MKTVIRYRFPNGSPTYKALNKSLSDFKKYTYTYDGEDDDLKAVIWQINIINFDSFIRKIFTSTTKAGELKISCTVGAEDYVRAKNKEDYRKWIGKEVNLPIKNLRIIIDK